MTDATIQLDTVRLIEAIDAADVQSFTEHLEQHTGLHTLTLERDGQTWPILHHVLAFPLPPGTLDARLSMAYYLATRDVDMHQLGPDDLTALSRAALALRHQPEWDVRIETLRFFGKLIDVWPSSHPEDHLQTDHDSLLSHARWEDEHGDPDVLAPATRDLAQLIHDVLNYTPPVEGELREDLELDGSTFTFTDYPLMVTNGHHVRVSNGTLEYEGYELGSIIVEGHDASLTLTDVRLDDISVYAIKGARIVVENCTVTGRYGNIGTRDRGSTGDIKGSTFRVAEASASDHSTLDITDTSFEKATRSAVNANAHAAVTMTRGSISDSPVAEFGATAYKGGVLTLDQVYLADCWTFLRSIEAGSQIIATRCTVDDRHGSSMLLARATRGGSVTLAHTEIHPGVEDLVEADDDSHVTFEGCTREP